MKKATLIIGPRDSGKSILAEKLAKKYLPNEVFWIPARHKNLFDNPFLYHGCTKETKLIIFDDASPEIYDHLIVAYNKGITVNTKGAETFIIHPRIIVTLSSQYFKKNLTNCLDESLLRRLHVIELKSKKNILNSGAYINSRWYIFPTAMVCIEPLPKKVVLGFEIYWLKGIAYFEIHFNRKRRTYGMPIFKNPPPPPLRKAKITTSTNHHIY